MLPHALRTSYVEITSTLCGASIQVSHIMTRHSKHGVLEKVFNECKPASRESFVFFCPDKMITESSWRTFMW